MMRMANKGALLLLMTVLKVANIEGQLVEGNSSTS